MATITVTASKNVTIGDADTNPIVINVNPIINYTPLVIAGFTIDNALATDTELKQGHTFYGWYNEFFYRGKILRVPLTLPDDLHDKEKVGLVQNTSY